jgi:hypothetical protein
MSRNRPPDSGRQAQPGSAQKIDIPVRIVSTLTAFFAILFATLLLLRPESSDPTDVMPVGARSAQSAPRVTEPPVSAPPVSASPPKPILSAEPKPEPKLNPTLQTELEQLGIRCAAGATCDVEQPPAP